MLAGWIVITLGEQLPNGPHFWLIAVIGFAIAAVAMLAERRYGAAFEGPRRSGGSRPPPTTVWRSASSVCC